jgi:cysteinyl-tRNA synthetase
MAGIETLNKLVPSESAVSSPPAGEAGQQSAVDNNHPASSIQHLLNNCYDAMNDDFNTPIVIANLFEGVRIINSVNDKKETISTEDLALLKSVFNTFVFDILGLKEETSSGQNEIVDGLMQLILSIRQKVKENKDFQTSDTIREELSRLKISVKDTKDGPIWSQS